MSSILEIKADELRLLDPCKVDGKFTTEEVIHIARELGAFWEYDYDAADQGKVGLHAELKSGRHSDGFFVSRILLEPENIRAIFAIQMSHTIRSLTLQPDFLIGIPTGATKLADDISFVLTIPTRKVEKTPNGMELLEDIAPGKFVLLIEDIFTKGTAVIEAVKAVTKKCPAAIIKPSVSAILNRGGQNGVSILGRGYFYVDALVAKLIRDWDPAECPLCKMGSKSIKPKATDENWLAITTSQK